MDLAAGLANSGKVATDGRRSRRQRVLLSGKIVFDHTARSIDCTLRDLSPRGARVRLTSPEPTPDRFYLIEFRQGLTYEAHVEWRRTAELGVTFANVHRLDNPTSPEMRTMRRIWLEHVAR